MEVAENLKAVAELIEDCINESGLVPSFKELVIKPLTLNGKVLSQKGTCRWPLFVLSACESASSGSCNQAIPAAAAMEMLTTAFDILDDVQDDDYVETDGPREKANLLNVSAALIFLSQRTLLRLRDWKVDESLILAVSDTIASLVLKSGNGQHLDIVLENSPDVTIEQAFEMTALKAGSLVECAFRVGAMLGTTDEKLIELYAALGHQIGIIAQLMNDLHDVLPDSNGKSDIRRKKKTVPIAFGQGEQEFVSDDIIAAKVNRSAVENDEVARKLVWQQGGVHYAWVLTQMRLYEAQEILTKIRLQRPTESLFKAFIQPYL